MKKRLALVAMLLTMGTIGMVCSADEAEPVAVAQAQTDDGETVEPRVADHIEIIYRNNNGHLEYRRWNYTKGYWVDPYWIRLG